MDIVRIALIARVQGSHHAEPFHRFAHRADPLTPDPNISPGHLRDTPLNRPETPLSMAGREPKSERSAPVRQTGRPRPLNRRDLVMTRRSHDGDDLVLNDESKERR